MKQLYHTLTAFLSFLIASPVFAFHDSLEQHGSSVGLQAGEILANPGLAFPVVVVSALRDSFTLCMLAFIMVIAGGMIVYSKNRKKALSYAFTFVATTFVVYWLLGFFITPEIEIFITSSQFLFAHDIFSLGIAGILFVMGLLNVQDYFFGKKLWYSAAEREVHALRNALHASVNPLSFVAAVISTPLLLVCTLPSYIHATLTLKQNLPAYQFISFHTLYSFIFTLPLILVLSLMISIGTHMMTHDLHSDRHRFLKIAKGLIQITAALLVLYVEL